MSAASSLHASPQRLARLRKRRAAERRFRIYGLAAILFSILALGWLLFSIFATGLSAFIQYRVNVELDVNASDTQQIELDHRQWLAGALLRDLDMSDDASARRELLQVLSVPSRIGDASERLTARIPLTHDAERYVSAVNNETRELIRNRLSARKVTMLDRFRQNGLIERRFDAGLFIRSDSRDPEQAGLATAILGSVMILLIAGALALPVGVGAAIYLDSFAPRTGWKGHVSRLLEVNINNLAAVPAIVIGLLGLAVFINVVGLARSIPLVGGLVMALRIFPTVVIATRAALASVPSALTDSALSLGASRMQAVFTHRVPMATPGILTGAILALAQALGETAPLLLIGMVAFVTRIPESATDPATALPVQIYLWSGSVDPAWAERAGAAIIILLFLLLLINAAAIILRARLQRSRKL